MIEGQKRSFMKFQDVRAFLDSVLDEDIHTKRVDSLANATLGVMTGASLAVAMIGKSLAQARGLLPKHAIKQVDRLLSNSKLFGFLGELGFDYVIRLKSNTKLSAADGTARPAREWVGQGGRARKLRDAAVTEA